MSQNATALPVSGLYSGLVAATDINAALDTVISNFSGAAAPGTPTTWQLWADTTLNLLKQWNGSVWLILGSFAANQWVPYSNGVKQSAPTTTGSANAYVLAYSPVTSALVAGQLYFFIANFSNTGPATINIDGHGAIAITKQGMTALASGDIATGQAVAGLYDGTQLQDLTPGGSGIAGPGSSTDHSVVLWNGTGGTVIKNGPALGVAGQFLGSNGAGADPSFQTLPATVTAATQADMEAASSTTVFASPGRMKYEPGVAKAWAKVTNSGTPTLSQGRNISSLTDNGAGDVTINFTTAFSAATYAYGGAARAFTSSFPTMLTQSEATAPATGGCRIRTCRQDNGSGVDVDFSVEFFGDQ